MYSGQGHYYPQPSVIHDESALTFVRNQPVYHTAVYHSQPQDPHYPIYRNPPPSVQAPPPIPGLYYPSQPVYAAPMPPPALQSSQPAQFTRQLRYDPRPMLQHHPDDPAYSEDPRMNPHYIMDDREEITPTESSYSNYPYLARENSHPGTSSQRELQATHGPIYGPSVVPEQISQASSNRGGPYESKASIYAHSSYARSSEDLRKSPESVPLAYDSHADASSASLSASQMTNSNKSAHAFSSTSLNQTPPSPYEIFVPRSPSTSSSRSSSSSSPSPPTPPAAPGVLSLNEKRSTSLPRSLLVVNPDTSAESHDAPPAYSPLPTPAHDTFAPAANAAAISSASAINVIATASTSSDAPAAGRSAADDIENNTIAFPSAVVRSNAPSISAPEALPASAGDITNRSTKPPPPDGAPEPIRVQKSRSRKTSIATVLKDLDKIDELDETDPLGYAWHHESPYEAIKKAVESGLVPGDASEQKKGQPKIFQTRPGTEADHSEASSRRKPVAVDPNLTAFNVKPGHIFPSIVATSQAHIAHQQMFGYAPASMSGLPAQQPAPRMYTNAHMHPGTHRHPPPPKPIFPPPQAEQGPPTPEQTTQTSSSNGSSHSERREQPLSVSDPQVQQARSSPSQTPPGAKTRPSLQHQASNVSLSRSVSAPSRAQDISSQGPPRPDIRLPPRGAPSTTSSQQSGPPHQSRFRPKHLVMPAPLQTQTQPAAPSNGSGSSGDSSRRSHERERNRENREKELAFLRGERVDGNTGTGGAFLKHSVSVPSRAPKAEDIPMSSGRNLLKKHKEKGDGAYREPEVREKPRERGGVHIGGFTIIPALGHNDKHTHGSKGWQRDKEREKEREREREREREKEREKDKAKKLSRRR